MRGDKAPIRILVVVTFCTGSCATYCRQGISMTCGCHGACTDEQSVVFLSQTLVIEVSRSGISGTSCWQHQMLVGKYVVNSLLVDVAVLNEIRFQ